MNVKRMWLFFIVLIFSFLSSLTVVASDVPYFKKQGKATQLIVDGKPFLMIAGELHNSTSSTTGYLDSIWPRLEMLNLNTVLAAVSWEQFEPKEGVYDYEIIDHLIKKAGGSNMRLVILWFGSWKNGQSSYAPMWVKAETSRFPRVLNSEGKEIETLSLFNTELMEADTRAYTALVKRIKKVDKKNTVVMLQPQNEVGVFQSIDYSPGALAEFQKKVPAVLTDYLVSRREKLNPYLLNNWVASGEKKSGTWKEVFGDTPAAKEFFMAWHYATFINNMAREGKKILPLPVFVNAWLVQAPDDLPGVYPNGGPVSRVIDIYKAAAPYIDAQAPDIYLHNYKEILSEYHRDDNPLIIPESLWNEPSRAFYAFAQHDALLFAPFGIDNPERGDEAFAQAYGVLKELSSLIVSHQGLDRMIGLRREGNEKYEFHEMGGYRVEIQYQREDEPAYGMIVQTGEDEYIISGINFRAKFTSLSSEYIGYIGQVLEGRILNGNWITTRVLNGDETFHHEALLVVGRDVKRSKAIAFGESVAPQPSSESFNDLSGELISVPTPGVYKVKTYRYKARH